MKNINIAIKGDYIYEVLHINKAQVILETIIIYLLMSE